jgi:hypothetical protein
MSESPTPQPSQSPTPLRCFFGSIVAGGLAFALYNMTSAIAISFATKPISSDNLTVQRISAAVRTLVVGLSTMGTGIFALAAIGLFGLGIQLLLTKSKDSSTLQ